MEDLEKTGDLKNYCSTVMPDHVHWLFQLGARLSLGRVVARWKATTCQLLSANGLEWQRDFFERRLREEESVESYGLYVFLNPYRKKLISENESWPHWRVWNPAIFEFSVKMRDGALPQREWLKQCQQPPWTERAGAASLRPYK